MISKSCLTHLRRLAGVCHDGRLVDQLNSRSLATLVDAPVMASRQEPISTHSTAESDPSSDTHVTTTVYSFPTLEPTRFAYYHKSHLFLPLRKDILHRAVIFEGDATRQGTASTKWRDEVHGSHKKHHPQKGTGRARAGDKQSPIFRGGGVAFGPKPRDFSTGLNRKVYDLAWRTALSYRYRRGQLIIVDYMQDLESAQQWYMRDMFEKNGWGRNYRRSLLIAASKQGKEDLFKGMDTIGRDGRILEAPDVDVKDLLERGRVIIEKKALDRMLMDHASDLAKPLGLDTSIPSESWQQATVNDGPRI